MIFPAMVTASADRPLRGMPLCVYVWLVGHCLDFVEFRRCKVEWLASQMGIKDDTASRALRILVQRGYLERKYSAREGYGYRVRLTRAHALGELGSHLPP